MTLIQDRPEEHLAPIEPALMEIVPGPRPHGLVKYITSTDHKQIGLNYMVTAFIGFLVAGVMALGMRTQLIVPNNHFVSLDAYNQLVTMHGTIMLFVFLGPFAFAGLGNYLIPLMIGAPDMAFPRFNNLSYWLYLGGFILMTSGFLTNNGAADFGWFAYAPLTERAFTPGNATDYWNLAVLVVGIGTIATAINLLATILTMRGPGMTLGRMPVFVWEILTISCMTLIILPPLSACQIMLLLDRYLGAHFFDTQAGGSAIMWQHFFWFFGHPEVYILMLPGFGFASEIIPVFSRKVLFGYVTLVAASVGIGLVAMGTWAHHMFAVGMGRPLNSAFSASTMLVGVPTGVKLFNWLGTLHGGKIRFQTPMLFCSAFLFEFLCAGLTGIMLSVVPFDWQLEDSYFVVAHFHFVLIGGLIFTLFGALYYWFPKATGRMLSERLGRWHFWLFTIGFNLTFLTMHIPGMLGMARRIYTYPADRGWDVLNLVTTLGVPLQAVAVLLFVVNIVMSLRRGAPAGNDPWDAWTLEWATSSPPPPYNFAVVPPVSSRRPLWDLKHPDDPDGPHE